MAGTNIGAFVLISMGNKIWPHRTRVVQTRSDARAAMLFDDILCQIGELGSYQVVLYALLGLVAIPTGWQEFASVFVAGDQNHWCRVPRLENFTQEEQRCLAIPEVADLCQQRPRYFLEPQITSPHPGPMSAYSRCHMFDFDFDKFTDLQLERRNRSQVITPKTPVKPCSSWVFEKTHFRSTLVSDMELVCNKSSEMAYVQVVFHSGYMAGSVVFGAISDRFGRHRTLLLTLCLQVVFGASAAFTTYYPAFLALRFLDGTSVAGAFDTAFVMIMEMIGPRRRMGAGIFVRGWFACGIMTLSGVAYAVRDQRKLQCMLSMPVAILLIYYWIVPESPRWYASHGRFVDAERVLRRMAEVNGRELPECLQLEENQSEIDAARLGRHPCLIDLFLTKNMRIKTCILHCIWFANAFAYHACVSHMAPVSGNMYLTTFLHGAAELPVFVVCLAIINRVGRRWPTIVIMTILSVVCLLCIPCLQNPGFILCRTMHVNGLRINPYDPQNYPKRMPSKRHGLDDNVRGDRMPGLTAVSMVGKLVAAAGFASLNVFSAETFPTTVRGSGLGLGSMCSGLGGVLARQTTEAKVYTPVPMIMASMLTIGGAMLAFLLPETADHNLPESLIEGEEFGRECIAKLLQTRDVHRSFITERVEREARKKPESACTTLNMEPIMVEMSQSI